MGIFGDNLPLSLPHQRRGLVDWSDVHGGDRMVKFSFGHFSCCVLGKDNTLQLLYDWL